MSGLRLRNHTRLLASTPIGYFKSARPSRSYLDLILLSRRGHAMSAGSLPRIAQPSLWESIVPKFLRQPRLSASSTKSPRSKEWNPATFFIMIFLLIGSNAIQMISLKNDFANFNRRTDSKIALLKEIIERVQKGEEVDVEGLLGSGDPEKEREWEAVIEEIEQEGQLWRSKGKKRDKKPSSNDPEDASIPNLKPPRISEAGTETTSREDRSHSGDRKEAGEKSSPSAPRTFY